MNTTMAEFSDTLRTLAIDRMQSDQRVPWRQPFLGHRNVFSASGNGYRGGNALMCSLTAQAKGFDVPHWGTFNQIRNAGGMVTKGEKATSILLARPIEKRKADTPDQEHPAAVLSGDPASKVPERSIIFGKAAIFNAKQTEGIDWEKVAKIAPTTPAGDPTEVVIAAIGSRMPEIYPGSDSRYDQASGAILLGDPDRYRSGDHRAWCLASFAAAASAEPGRMNREVDPDKPSAKVEEAIAQESAATIVLHRLGIGQTAYHDAGNSIGEWSRLLSDPKVSLSRAIGRGEKIADWLLNGSGSPS